VKRVALVVQHHPADAPGAVARELGARGVELRTVRGSEGEAVPSSIADVAGLVVMGGPFSIDDVETHPYLATELALIRSAIRAGVPILGVCLGAQLLARALGGGVARGAAPEIGWLSVQRSLSEPDPLFDGVPADFVPFHWHGDAIVLPSDADADVKVVRLARSALADVQAFRVGSESSATYGLQFHLESDAAMIEEMVRAFDGELLARGIDGATLLRESRARLVEQERLGRLIFGRWAEAVVRGRM
jgi:GMP synthase (glutamine-hydrolysing)